MDLNVLLFPAPEYYVTSIEYYEGELIFIPKSENKNENLSNQKNLNKISDHIPCLFLMSDSKKISKNFCIFFHGNAEDIFAAREIADRIRIQLSMNVIIVEYPGYSVYKDDKNSDKILEDSLTVFDYFNKILEIDKENIFIIGRSIGTAPALYLSSKRRPASLILMSPFTSIRAVAENLVGQVLKYLVNEKFTNIEYIKEVTCPILFIHGQLDDIIPFDHTMKLKEACKCPYEVLLPEEMNHNQFHYENDFLNPFKDFIKRNTGYTAGELSKVKIPNNIFKIPLSIREVINNLKVKEKSTSSSCFGYCENGEYYK